MGGLGWVVGIPLATPVLALEWISIDLYIMDRPSVPAHASVSCLQSGRLLLVGGWSLGVLCLIGHCTGPLATCPSVLQTGIGVPEFELLARVSDSVVLPLSCSMSVACLRLGH